MKPITAFGRKLDWNLLRTFHVIAESGSLTSAAKRLQRKQPSVSLALRRLEVRLGKQLCIRNPHKFELTTEGFQVAEICKEIFSSINVMPDTLGQEASVLRGTLRIVAMSNIVSSSLNTALTKFHMQSPLVRTEIQVVTWGEINRQLARKDADVGLGTARFFRSEFKYYPLVREFHRIYCGPSHPMFGETVRSTDALSECSMILTGGDEADAVRSYREKHRIGQQVIGVSEYLDEAKRLTECGLGLCFLPHTLVQRDVDAGRLWQVWSHDEELTLDIFSISSDAPSLVAQAFIKCLQEHKGGEFLSDH